MAMQINTNVFSLNTQRALDRVGGDVSRSISRLSSGLRISSAKDDAAGIAITARMTAQIRGMNQAARNANDGISLLQTAEGALGSLTDNLQRIRELAVQAANGSNSASDRQAPQKEAAQLLQEVDRIGQSTEFNGDLVFAQGKAGIGGDLNQRAVVDGLKLGWLEESENLIRQYYGLQGDGAAMAIDITAFTDGAGNTAARVTGSGADANGRIGNVRLQVDMADFTPPNLPDGGNAPFYNDRIIAHEMVHAVQYRSLNVASMSGGAAATSTWFLEGMAEFIHGADERVAADIAAVGGAANLVSGNSISSWDGDSGSYSTAYVAFRYLHDKMKSAGYSGVKEFLTYMSTNSATLDAAFNNFFGQTHAQFRTEFQTNAVNFINTKMNLSNEDTGAVGGADADGGDVRTAKTVLLDIGGTYGDNVLRNFEETFEDVQPDSTAGRALAFQVGAQANQTIDVSLGAVNIQALGLAEVDLSKDARRSIVHLDQALDYLNRERAKVGAQMARMESSIATLQTTSENQSASRSRILDADYAQETAGLLRAQIIQQAATSMLAQANALPQQALQLLR